MCVQRYKGAVEGLAVQPPRSRTLSAEEREAQRQRQQSRYAQSLGESSVKWRV